MGAPGVEVAPFGGRERAGDVPDQAFFLPDRVDVGHRRGREQGLGVGVEGVFVEVRLGLQFHEPAEVHDGHPVADVAHHREVVGDEEIGQMELLLEVHEEVDDLCLDGDVQGRDRLVADDQLRLEGQGPADADALALPAAELVGVPVDGLGPEPHDLHDLPHPFEPVGCACPRRG